MGIQALTRMIGSEVRARRLELGLTQIRLSTQAGVSERLLRSLEAGEAMGIGLDKLSAILDSLGLELGILGTPSMQGAAAQSEEYGVLLKETVASWKHGDAHA